MSYKPKFTSKFPLDTVEDSRAFIAQLTRAFAACDSGDSAGQAFSEFVAALGFFPVDGDQWMTLRTEFLDLAEESSDSPEMKTAALVNERCVWLESPFVKGRREAEKRPVPRDGKQPPIPSPFAR